MDAVVTAGGIPQVGEPLYPYTQGGYKALLDVVGKPMIQWVLDALASARRIEKVVVIGLPLDTQISCSKLSSFLPNQGDMLENIRAGIKQVQKLNPHAHHVLVVSSDIPAITPDMVDWVVDTTMHTDDDVYYNVIERKVMESRFPSSKRTYTRLKDVEVCGGDMVVVRAMTVISNEKIWSKIIAARKSVFKQASLIGYDTLVLMLLRAVTLEGAVKTAANRLNITGRAILCPFAEIGMDIDKPHQLEIIRLDLANQVKA